MRKFLSIPVILMLLFPGFTFNVAMHYCGGELAGTKVSFSGKLADCGMEHQDKSNEVVFASHCCENVVNSYTFNNDYFPSQVYLADINIHINNQFQETGLLLLQTLSATGNDKAIKPPGYEMRAFPNSVSRPEICIYRI